MARTLAATRTAAAIRSGQDYDSVILADSPAVYHKLTGGSGLLGHAVQLADSSGNGRAIATYVQATGGGSVRAGEPGALTVNSNTSLRMNEGITASSNVQTALTHGASWDTVSGFAPWASSRTFEIWCKMDLTDNDEPALNMLWCSSSSDNTHLYTFIARALNVPGQVRYAPRGNGAGTQGAWNNAFPIDQNWHHVVITHGLPAGAFATAELFIDGESEGAQTVSDWQTTAPTFGYMFGSWYGAAWSWPWVGNVANHAMYPTILSAAQIRKHYQTGRPVRITAGSRTAA